MKTNRKQTSRTIAQLAGKTLRDPRASKRGKSLAASALAQSATKRTRPTPRAKPA